MTLFFTARRALKRGGLVAAANWPIILIQASADALFKLVVAVPFVGGVVLVALIVGAEPVALLGLDLRDLAATILALLLARPLALAGLCRRDGRRGRSAASVFIFLLKGGTVALLVRAERDGRAPSRSRRCRSAVRRHGRRVHHRALHRGQPRDLFPRFRAPRLRADGRVRAVGRWRCW